MLRHVAVFLYMYKYRRSCDRFPARIVLIRQLLIIAYQNNSNGKDIPSVQAFGSRHWARLVRNNRAWTGQCARSRACALKVFLWWTKLGGRLRARGWIFGFRGAKLMSVIESWIPSKRRATRTLWRRLRLCRCYCVVEYIVLTIFEICWWQYFSFIYTKR